MKPNSTISSSRVGLAGTRRQVRLTAKYFFSASLMILLYGQQAAAQVNNLTAATGPFATIQAAINAASAGDELEVMDGTYNENVVVNKSIFLHSVNGKAATSIVGSDNGTLGTVYISPGVSNVTIGASGQGFTIVGFDNDNGAIEAAAVYFPNNSSNVTIQFNEIVADGEHGLLSNYNSNINNIVIDNNEFSGQTFAGANPGGIGFSTQFNNPNNVPRQLVTLGGGENPTLSMNITFTNNLVSGKAGGISTNDGVSEQGNSLVTIDVLGATISGNTFAGTTTRFSPSLRVRGSATDVFGNTFSSAGLTALCNHFYGGNGSSMVGAVTSPTLDAVGLNNTYDKGSYISNTTTMFYIDLHPQVSYGRLVATNNGDEIKVFPSSYQTAGQIAITNSVEFVGLGANKSMTVLTTNQNTGAGGDARGWFLVNEDVELSMQNLTLDGSGFLVYQGIRHKGYGTFDNVHFTEIKYNESGPHYSGVAIAAFGSAPNADVHVLNSMFTEIGRVGVLYFGTGQTASIYNNNMYTGKGAGDWLDYALDISAGANVTVTNSTVTNNLGFASSDGSKSAGYLVSTFFGAGTTAEFTNNNVLGNTCGITVGYDASDASSVVANYNNITGNVLAGVNTTNPTVDATYNWWGNATGPSGDFSGLGDGAFGDVLVCPWLDGTFETNPSAVEGPDCPNCQQFCSADSSKIYVCHIKGAKSVKSAKSKKSSKSSKSSKSAKPVVLETKCVKLKDLAKHVAHGDACGPCAAAKSLEFSAEEELTLEIIPILVYPVPFDHSVNVKIDQTVMDENSQAVLRIFDIVGKEITNFRISTSEVISINTSDWNNGLYIYQLTGTTGLIASGRIVKD